MNPLTLVKRIQKINSQEASLGISEEASWHAKYKDSAYVFVGGIPYDLTEGDLLAVFAQYGEIVDVNLVRDKGTGKSKGFAFVAYEDQRSTNLAVDNLNGAQILGRIIRVDHVSNYKKKEEEDEETEQRKREARGVCRAFQRGECSRGAGCKFSHDEQRAANTGWGAEDASSKWGHDKFEDSKDCDREMRGKGRKNVDDLERHSREIGRRQENKLKGRDDCKESDLKLGEDRGRKEDRRLRRHDDDFEPKSGDNHDKREERRARGSHDGELSQHSRRDHNRRNEDRSKRHGDEEYQRTIREDDDRRERDRSVRHHSESYRRENQDEIKDNHDGEISQHSRRDHNRRDEDRPKRNGDEEYQPTIREDDNRMEVDRSVRHHSESYRRENQDERKDLRSSHGRDSLSHRKRNEDPHRSDK